MKYHLTWVSPAFIRADEVWSSVSIINESRSPLENGQYSFDVYLEGDESALENVRLFVGLNSSKMIELAIERVDLSPVEIRGMSNIIKGLLPRITGRKNDDDIIDISLYEEPGYTLFRPFGPYYLSYSQSTRVTDLIDLESMIGYDLLSADPMVWLALNKHQNGSRNAISGQPVIGNDLIKSLGVVYWQGAALIPVSNTSDLEIVDSIRAMVTNLNNDGYFYYLLNPFGSELDLIKDLLVMFPQMSIEHKMADYLFIKGASQFNRRFLETAIDLIQGGSLPQVIIDLDIVIPVTIDGNRMSRLQTTLQLKYWCQIAYAQMAEVNQAYLNTIGQIEVLSDMRLSVYLGSEAERQWLSDIIAGFMSNTDQPRFVQMSWEDCIIGRIIIAIEHPNYKPLVLDHTGQYFLAYVGDQLPDMEGLVNQRHNEILAYTQQVCNDNNLNFENFRSCLSIPNPILEAKIDLNTLALRGVLDLGQNQSKISGLASQIRTSIEGNIEIEEIDQIYYFMVGSTPILALQHDIISDNNTLEEVRLGLQRWYERGDLFSSWSWIQYYNNGIVDERYLRYYPEFYEVEMGTNTIDTLLFMLQ